MKNNFGFTNDTKEFEDVVAYKKAMIEDGWSCYPTYPNIESDDSAATLRKQDFHALIKTRTKIGKWLYETEVCIWGPDGLRIITPTPYSWEGIVAALRHCNVCGKEDVDTERFSFAGRCCKTCLPEKKKKHEYPGWTN